MLELTYGTQRAVPHFATGKRKARGCRKNDYDQVPNGLDRPEHPMTDPW